MSPLHPQHLAAPLDTTDGFSAAFNQFFKTWLQHHETYSVLSEETKIPLHCLLKDQSHRLSSQLMNQAKRKTQLPKQQHPQGIDVVDEEEGGMNQEWPRKMPGAQKWQK
jgi:hypothetical protein